MNSSGLEIKSDALWAIQVVLDKNSNELIKDIVSPSYLSLLKREKRSHNRKTLGKILNNQGIPFSFYEIICDFESVIKENVKDKKGAWMCLLLATLGIIFKYLHDKSKDSIKIFFNLELPDIDYEQEIMKEYELIKDKDKEKAKDFLKKAKELILYEGNIKETFSQKDEKIPLKDEEPSKMKSAELLILTEEILKITEYIINIDKSNDEKIIINSSLREQELRYILNREGLLYESFIELLNFKLKYQDLTNYNDILIHAANGLFYEDSYLDERRFIKSNYNVDLPYIDFELKRLEEQAYWEELSNDMSNSLTKNAKK